MKRIIPLLLVVLAFLAFTALALADDAPPGAIGPAPPPSTIGPPPQGPISAHMPAAPSGILIPQQQAKVDVSHANCLTQSVSWRTLGSSKLVLRFSSVEVCAGHTPVNGKPSTMRRDHVGQPVYVSYPGCADFKVTSLRGTHNCP